MPIVTVSRVILVVASVSSLSIKIVPFSLRWLVFLFASLRFRCHHARLHCLGCLSLDDALGGQEA